MVRLIVSKNVKKCPKWFNKVQNTSLSKKTNVMCE